MARKKVSVKSASKVDCNGKLVISVTSGGHCVIAMSGDLSCILFGSKKDAAKYLRDTADLLEKNNG